MEKIEAIYEEIFNPKTKCPSCGNFRKLTRDHIVPKSKGGSDCPTNIQHICRRCNSRKGVNQYKFI